MSLIPNESYSFPDHFLRAQSRARAQHQKNVAAPAKTRESMPARPVERAPAAPIERAPVPIVRAPVPVMRPPVSVVRAPTAAPPSRIAPPVKLPANARPRSLSARPAAPAKPARPAFVPRPPAPQPKIDKSNSARPAAAPSIEEFQFDFFAEETQRRSSKSGRGKLLRFLLVEGLAAIILIPCAILILLRYLTDPTLIMVTNIAAIASAIALAIIPIVFFAFGPTLPRGGD